MKVSWLGFMLAFLEFFDQMDGFLINVIYRMVDGFDRCQWMGLH